jgi:histidinol phosphatase-like PHP family hydrolase
MLLAGDGHVHSEWSRDTGGPSAAAGRMEAMCRRALKIGLPALAFTEHLDSPAGVSTRRIYSIIFVLWWAITAC